MKFFGYISISTLIGTVASSTLRGADREEDIATPRFFNEQYDSIVRSTAAELSSALWIHKEEEYGQQSGSVKSPSHGGRSLQNCDNTQTLLSVTLLPDAYSQMDNKFTVSVRENDSWRRISEKVGTFEGDFTVCISSDYYKFEALDSHADGIRGGGYVVSLGGNKIFHTPDGDWSRVVHKFNVLGSSTSSSTNESSDMLKMLRTGATDFPTSSAVAPPAPPAQQPTPATLPPPSPTAPIPPPPTPPSPPPPSPPPPTAPASVSTMTAVSVGTMTDRDLSWLNEHNIRRQK
jgi:hypothetical protein